MSKIASAFKNGKAFIPFITCGDLDLETTSGNPGHGGSGSRPH